MNPLDKTRKRMNIIVGLKDRQINGKKNLIKAGQIICPQCGEIAKIFIKDYRINIFGCKNNHTTYNISFNKFEETQIIDESKIICGKCKDKNKENSFNKQFYICWKCKLNLCPLCKVSHDKNHYVMEYELKNYICPEHGENYSSYCQTCDKNICIECGSMHSTHNIIYFGKILPNKDILNNVLNEMKNNIDKFKSELNNIINRFNYVIDIADNYYKLVKGIYDSLKIKKKNYEIMYNINNINNDDFIKDIQNIINDNHIHNKLIKVNILYDKMTNNFKNNSYNSISFSKDFYFEEDTKSILQREFNKLKKESIIRIGCNFIHINDIMLMNNNLFEWVFSINGPELSPYYGGKFYLKFLFGENYPEWKPEIRFVTPFFHCNVNNAMNYGLDIDPLGYAFIDIMKDWTPKNTIKEVIIEIYNLFFEQNPESPFSLEMADLYKNNRQHFIERIKYFTKKYANPSFPYKEYDSWDFSYTMK